MVVYAIKNHQTKEYLTESMDFIPELWQAELFNDYEVAKCYCPSDCLVVKCCLMEENNFEHYYNSQKDHFIPNGAMSIKDTAEANRNVLEKCIRR